MTNNTNPTIHWLGAGLSSKPGIKLLAESEHPLIVWNRSLAKAQATLNDIADNTSILQLDWDVLAEAINPGDVVVSMLPASKHLQVTTLCLDKQAHFVSSSYISADMAALDHKAKALNLCLVNEVGLDPGIDHLFAHDLVAQYHQSEQFNPDNELYFRSYCGGFPKIVNDFKYKFSWSPLGVLKALKSPAKWISAGETKTSQAPWEALRDYPVDLVAGQETFQAYPNRDSTPFIEQYQLADDQVKEFVRGTLRLAGWSTAWQYLFDEIALLSVDESEARLTEISQQLEQKYAYNDDEPDRVVLYVELEAKQKDEKIWQQSYLLDCSGNASGQAMARLVSIPVAFAILSVLNNEIKAGVSAAPKAPKQVRNWIKRLTDSGESISNRNHLA
ncbi:saccharopine dehydrogenase family protein [Thalassotalea sp. ND16A]|uniref:saccharopine dehydrogenase family protein n=1 Tax=Thalassotalea sp. ND16A TaxID=1535422 RepID=UPI00051A3CEF|nr:saccharopine dehydrogenase family protein [Thalassotalea sp. ND16A]KGJ89383.1 Saccharopine dehydrogenase (NADP(+), L-glutamate-forming) [Thalassotalea sp. ND16A]